MFTFINPSSTTDKCPHASCGAASSSWRCLLLSSDGLNVWLSMKRFISGFVIIPVPYGRNSFILEYGEEKDCEEIHRTIFSESFRTQRDFSQKSDYSVNISWLHHRPVTMIEMSPVSEVNASIRRRRSKYILIRWADKLTTYLEALNRFGHFVFLVFECKHGIIVFWKNVVTLLCGQRKRRLHKYTSVWGWEPVIDRTTISCQAHATERSSHQFQRNLHHWDYRAVTMTWIPADRKGPCQL